MAGEDLTLIGHVARLPKYAVELRQALVGGTTTKRVVDRIHQIARELEAEADQLEKIARTKP